jgi:hypothetical protein
MTSRARARYPAFGQFASDSGLSEGWARWAFADNVAYYAHPVDPEGREAVVVTIAGTRQAEGATESAAASMVVDIGKKRALVDPLTGGTSIVPVGELGAGGAFNAGEPLSLEARVPKSARDVYFLVSPRPRSADAVQGASFDASHMLVQQRLDPLPAGDYWVTIAAFGPDGDTWTRSVEFRVE